MIFCRTKKMCYQVKRGQKVSTAPQRSLVDNILRKNLGHKRLAFRIWQLGLPSIADGPVFRGKVDECVLQSRMEECLAWFNAFASDLALGKKPSEKEAVARESRRRLWALAREKVRLGEELAAQRDRGKRNWDDMSQKEQDVLEKRDTGKLKKDSETLRVKRPKPFRSSE